MRAFIIALFCIGNVASMRGNRHLSHKDVAYLTELSRDLDVRTQSVLNSEVNRPIGSGCITDEECRIYNSHCEPIEAILEDLLTMANHTSELTILKRKAKIGGKECVRSMAEVVATYPQDQIIGRISEITEELQQIFGDYDLRKFGVNIDALETANFEIYDFDAPLTRVTGLAPSNPGALAFFILASRGTGGLSLDDNTILLLALTSVLQPDTTVDNNPLSNPFLLWILLGDGLGGGGSSTSDLLLLTLLGPGLGGGQGGLTDPSTPFSNPLILLSLLGDNNGIGGDGDNNLLLILALTGGLGGGTDAGGLGGLLPLLLLSNSSLGGSGGDNDLLLLMLLNGGTLGGDPGTGEPGAGFEQFLPLLLLGDGLGGGDNNLLLLLLLSGGGLGSQSLLPLLLLSDNNLLGGSNGDNDLLLLLLLSNGFGNTGGVDPVTGFPTGGFDNQQLLPFLLIRNSGSSNSLLLLFALGFFQNLSAASALP